MTKHIKYTIYCVFGHAGRFQSGQMDQTVNLTSQTSVVQIHLCPPDGTPKGVPFCVGRGVRRTAVSVGRTSKPQRKNKTERNVRGVATSRACEVSTSAHQTAPQRGCRFAWAEVFAEPPFAAYRYLTIAFLFASLPRAGNLSLPQKDFATPYIRTALLPIQ